MVNFDAFADWAENRFGDIVVSGTEVKINSIFDPDDSKYKMWCSPQGGKEKRKGGVYHCFKTDKKGTLVGLVMMVDGCSYEDAVDILGGDHELRYLEERLNYFLGISQPSIEEEPEEVDVPEEEKEKLTLPEGSCLISAMAPTNRFRLEAEIYLRGRKLPIEGLFYCIQGKYRNRIIIPYYDSHGNLIYFNGRHLWRDDPKYLGPPKELGIGKGDVIYMPRWPEPGETLCVTEGEFDAKILSLCGLNGAAVGGASLTDIQVKLLRPYRIVLCGDNDQGQKRDAGKNAVARMGSILLENGITQVEYVRSPKGFKDWNDLYLKFHPSVIFKYVTDRKKPFTHFTTASLS